MTEQEIHMGRVTGVAIEEGTLVVRFEDDGLMATGCPDWFREMSQDERSRWKQIEGALYWASADQTLRLRTPTFDPVTVAQALEDLPEDSEMAQALTGLLEKDD